MTKAEANALLNRVRDGEHFAPRLIRDALIVTGDLGQVDDGNQINRAAASAVMPGPNPVVGGPRQADSSGLRPDCSTQSPALLPAPPGCHWGRPFAGWIDLRRGWVQ